MSLKEITVPLAMVSERGGALKGGSPLAVFPVRLKKWCPVTSEEYATAVAAMTTRAFRTADTRRMFLNNSQFIYRFT